MSEKKTFKVVTLGCRTNQYESQAYATQLLEMGWSETAPSETADLCIINTCTVTHSADQSSRSQIRLLARQNPHSKLVVTGCLAERTPEAIGALPGVSHVIPNGKKEELLSIVFPEELIPEFSIKQFAAHTRAFVKVQDGCNSFCTYCIIPYVRGRSRSRRVEEIVKEVKELIASGYKEVVLTGINIGDYDGGPKQGEDPVRLAQLVREIDQIEGLKRLRLSSIDPDEVDEELAHAILEGEKTCHSMHLVLQSGSNITLKRMNRKYTRQIFLETVERLRLADPDFGFTTDVLVGFPGESDADFEDTLSIMREVQFAKVHMFPYSERKRTRAALFKDKIPHEIIQKRKQIVLRLSEEIAFQLRERFVGRRMSILVEGKESTDPEFLLGHTKNFLPVRISKELALPNDLIEVVLVRNTPEGLIGKTSDAN